MWLTLPPVSRPRHTYNNFFFASAINLGHFSYLHPDAPIPHPDISYHGFGYSCHTGCKYERKYRNETTGSIAGFSFPCPAISIFTPPLHGCKILLRCPQNTLRQGRHMRIHSVQTARFRVYSSAPQTGVPHAHKSENTQKYTEYTLCNGFETVQYTHELPDKSAYSLLPLRLRSESRRIQETG